jgi:hypothetical protein
MFQFDADHGRCFDCRPCRKGTRNPEICHPCDS